MHRIKTGPRLGVEAKPGRGTAWQGGLPGAWGKNAGRGAPAAGDFRRSEEVAFQPALPQGVRFRSGGLLGPGQWAPPHGQGGGGQSLPQQQRFWHGAEHQRSPRAGNPRSSTIEEAESKAMGWTAVTGLTGPWNVPTDGAPRPAPPTFEGDTGPTGNPEGGRGEPRGAEAPGHAQGSKLPEGGPSAEAPGGPARGTTASSAWAAPQGGIPGVTPRGADNPEGETTRHGARPVSQTVWGSGGPAGEPFPGLSRAKGMGGGGAGIGPGKGVSAQAGSSSDAIRPVTGWGGSRSRAGSLLRPARWDQKLLRAWRFALRRGAAWFGTALLVTGPRFSRSGGTDFPWPGFFFRQARPGDPVGPPAESIASRGARAHGEGPRARAPAGRAGFGGGCARPTGRNRAEPHALRRGRGFKTSGPAVAKKTPEKAPGGYSCSAVGQTAVAQPGPASWQYG
jgi:hypothetical protein